MIQIDFHMYMLAYSLMILILSMEEGFFFLQFCVHIVFV
jgi:hypothetical protein